MPRSELSTVEVLQKKKAAFSCGGFRRLFIFSKLKESAAPALRSPEIS
jgi:hypothetical protein